MISRVWNTRSYMPTMYQVGAARSHGLGTTDRIYLLGTRGPGSDRFETPDRTCLLGFTTALHDLSGSEHKIVHAYKASGGSCKISRVRNTRSYMLRRYQEGAAGWELQIVHAYEISRSGCRVSRVRDPRSNIPKRYQDGTAGSHGFGPTDSTCLQGIRSGLQDLTGKAHQIEFTYKV